MTKQLPEKDIILIKAFDWLCNESTDQCFIKLGWKPLFKHLEEHKHLFWAKLFVRLDVPDNFFGLKAVLPSIEWMLKDISLSEYVNRAYGDIKKVNTQEIKDFFEGESNELYELYDSDDFYGLLTKHPMYTLLMYSKGDRSQFSEYVLYPITWLLVFLTDRSEQAGQLYNINKQFRSIQIHSGVSVDGADEFSAGSCTENVLNNILEKDDKGEAAQYSLFLKSKSLGSALKLIKQVPKKSIYHRANFRGCKAFGSIVVGRNNQVSVLQGLNKDIPVEGFSEDVGDFKLEVFVNRNLLHHKEPSLKVLEPADYALSTMIEVPISGVMRSKPKRTARTARPEAELDLVKRKVNARFLGDTTIRANQYFLTNTSLLDDYTLEILIHELDLWSQSDFEMLNTKEGVHPVIAVAVLGVSLFFGMPIIKAIYKNKRKQLNRNLDGYFIVNHSGELEGHWLFETPLASLVSNNNTFAHTEDVENFYRLPMPLWLTEKIFHAEQIKKEYVDLGLAEKANQRTLGQLGFVWTIDDFKEEYNRFFERFRKKHAGLEINFDLVENYLLNASLHDYDVIYSAYFTNKRTIFSHTQLFYTRIQEKNIYSKFAEFWDARLFPLQENSSKLLNLSTWPTIKDDRYVGSALIPQKYVVKKIVSDLQVGLSLQSLESIQDVIQYHQTYTIYTMVFLSYSTGYRGVHTMIPSWRLLSEDGKWLAISDKDDEDSTHTRLTYLSRLAGRQLSLYKQHLSALLDKVLLLDFNLYSLLLDTLRDWQLKLSYRSESDRFVFDDSLQGAFFSIDVGKKQIREISLNYFFDFLRKEQHIELPANGGRHLLRTEAIEAGIPVDLLDAFLGHFIYGKEPHSSYSALTISEIENHMEPFLQEHLTSLGFKNVASRLT